MRTHQWTGHIWLFQMSCFCTLQPRTAHYSQRCPECREDPLVLYHLIYTHILHIHVHYIKCTSFWSWSTMGTPLISRISSPGLRGLPTRLRGSLHNSHTAMLHDLQDYRTLVVQSQEPGGYIVQSAYSYTDFILPVSYVLSSHGARQWMQTCFIAHHLLWSMFSVHIQGKLYTMYMYSTCTHKKKNRHKCHFTQYCTYNVHCHTCSTVWLSFHSTGFCVANCSYTQFINQFMWLHTTAHTLYQYLCKTKHSYTNTNYTTIQVTI